MEGVASCLKWLCKLIGAWFNFCCSSGGHLLLCHAQSSALSTRPQVLVSPEVPACDAAEDACPRAQVFVLAFHDTPAAPLLCLHPEGHGATEHPQLWWGLQPWWCALHLLMQPLIESSGGVGAYRTACPAWDAIPVLFLAHASCILTFIILWSWF